MKIKNDKPDIYFRLKNIFDIDWDKGIIITYGESVYCKFPISEDLEVHEGTHVKQQLDYGVEKWWDRYIEDVDFRFSQEKEAYLNQANWIKQNIKDRNERFKRLDKIATDFSSSIYGNIITKKEVWNLIK